MTCLELLTSGPHVQLVGPQAGLLRMQPKVSLTNRISAHLLAHLLILPVLVDNCAISNRMYDMYSLLAHFASQCLRQLTNGRATSTIRSELCITSERTKSAGEYEGLLNMISFIPTSYC